MVYNFITTRYVQINRKPPHAKIHFFMAAIYPIPILGFGWEFLYLYLIAWPAALAVSFRPIFGKSKEGLPLKNY